MATKDINLKVTYNTIGKSITLHNKDIITVNHYTKTTIMTIV
jgi:hypothetical protein